MHPTCDAGDKRLEQLECCFVHKAADACMSQPVVVTLQSNTGQHTLNDTARLRMHYRTVSWGFLSLDQCGAHGACKSWCNLNMIHLLIV